MTVSLISCIVPVFNGERYLSEALDSIFAQTYRPLEIIVVDDGSTDATASIIAGYGDRVHCLRQRNQGPASARNMGVRAARGEFIAFLDADDLWHHEKLQRQITRFAARPELELCITQVQHFWIPELKAEEERLRNHRLASPAPGYLIQALLSRRGLLTKVGLFDPSLRQSEDTDWFLRAFEKQVVTEIVPQVLVYRRLHGSNISRSSRQLFVDAVKLSLDRRRGRDGIAQPLELPTSARRDSVE